MICLAVDILPTEFSKEVRDFLYRTKKSVLGRHQIVALMLLLFHCI